VSFDMPIDWSPLVDFVRRHQNFVLTTHVRPDGDGLGSMLALDAVLRRMGKKVCLTVASTFPPRYRFLDPQSRVQRFTLPGEDFRNADAVVVLDTGTWNQLGDFGTFLRGHSAAKAVIDHHLTQDDLGAIRFVDVTAEATGRLVYEAIGALGEPLDREVATGLFVAVAMDTGWFRHANAQAPAYALASELIRAGAQPEVLYDMLFENNSLGRLKLTGLVLSRLQALHGGKVAFTEIRRSDYEATGATPQDSEDLVNYTRSVEGVEVGLLFMEQPKGGVKVSFRSRAAIDVARIAEKFGGGGHRLASGATIDAPLEEARDRVLKAVAAALDSV
jgi:bifunctional oligoribonuclease and PAP phosphatase NrnA